MMVLLALAATACAETPELIAIDRSLTPIIQRHFPDAEIKRTETAYVAKHGTMQFTVHNISKTGEIFPHTRHEEGPGFRGFMLEIDIRDGEYRGAAVIPQELHRPYWTTWIDAARVSGENKHLFVSFSYGASLNPEFRKALVPLLPKSER